MKEFVLDRYGKKCALRLADMPNPELRDDEVLVEVHAAGVNLLDSKIRHGEFKLILLKGGGKLISISVRRIQNSARKAGHHGSCALSSAC
jgi:NADPH:quinone reductase-like Zn-dependent oxidoreductase